jgi:hypothetical protein
VSIEPGVPEQFERNHAAIHQAEPGKCASCDRVVAARNKGHIHDDDGTVEGCHACFSSPAGKFHFENGHDYEIEWRIPGIHKKPRFSRVGFISANGSRISFDGRGPGRSNAKPYGGTAEIDRNWMISIREVTRDLSKRYTVRD